MKTRTVTPKSVEELQLAIVERANSLPKRLRQCADYVATNRDKIAVRTVAELAAEAGVQPSAFMRFCQLFGFGGFTEMQRLYRDSYAEAWPDYTARLESLRLSGADSPSALLAEFAEAGRLSLENLVKTIDARVLDASTRTLTDAGVIHVVGFRRSFPVAAYLAYALEKMDIPSLLHGAVGKLDNHRAMRPGDALIAVSFAPYTPDTIAMAEYAQGRDIAVVAITDAPIGPLARAATHVLSVSEADFGAFRSLSATLSLAVTLAVAIGAEKTQS